VVLNAECVVLKRKHHALKTVWSRSQRALENGLQRPVITMEDHIRFAKEKFVKLVECMNDS